MLAHKLKDESLFLAPTPAGAYFSVSGAEETPARQFLQFLLAQKKGFKLNEENLQKMMPVKDSGDASAMLTHMQKLGWVQGLERALEAPTDRLETILPNLLSQLSASSKALLADDQGFYISSCGFPHETAEELSGLSASLATLHDRYQGVLRNNLGENSSAWGLVDAMGNSQVGFWPMFIGEHRFGLVIGGLPQMNRVALISLVWALMMRYGKAVDQIED
ncbi:MAG: hypothetical protein GY697_15140 [Desulfobacterales bacterium]|nr:hypothetical protein [Desulfobacterales bacterium]